MITYDYWLNKNFSKLEDAYEDYLQMLDTTMKIPMDFDEFIEDKFEHFISDYQDRKYDEMKDERC